MKAARIALYAAAALAFQFKLFGSFWITLLFVIVAASVLEGIAWLASRGRAKLDADAEPDDVGISAE